MSHDMIFVVAATDGKIVDCNEQASRLLDHERADILGHYFREFDIYFGNAEDSEAQLRKARGGGSLRYESLFRTSQKVDFPVEVRLELRRRQRRRPDGGHGC